MTKAKNNKDNAMAVALMSKLAAGDETVFVELYKLLMPWAHRAAFSVSSDWELAHGTAQDALVSIYKNRERYREGASPIVWVSIIARDLCIKSSMSQVRRRAREIKTQGGLLETQDSPEACAAGRERTMVRAERLRAAIAELPERQRQIQNSVLAGKPLRETADILGVSFNNAKLISFRGRKALRSKLGDLHV